MNNEETIILIEDDPTVRRGCEQALTIANLKVNSFATAEAALARLDYDLPVVVISDVRLPEQSGFEVLTHIHKRDVELPVVLITGHGDVAMAVAAMRIGAYDFIEKPFSSERLVEVVRRAFEKRMLLLENRRLRERLETLAGEPMIGESSAMQNIQRLVAKIAPTNVDILISGETGTGKEVVAKMIHTNSRRDGHFVPINCGALPENIFESEIFGHESGAFTSASKRRIGKIEYAHNGTLFLDEIESMPLSLQVKLLRVLEERVIERLGSNESIAVNCRVLAATKTNLKKLSEEGKFRLDLYYRLNTITIDLPPLRERKEDIPLLMALFLRQASERYGCPITEWTTEDLLQWQQYEWPGNVRELKNTADRFCLGFPDKSSIIPVPVKPSETLAERIERAERSYIEDALRKTSGNIMLASEMLHIPKKTLYDKLQRYRIDAERYRKPT